MLAKYVRITFMNDEYTESVLFVFEKKRIFFNV